ncbi:hypothetical protein [Staphylococcus pasteuri]|uniref:hypothetical protein n=1 Tax=Staphylococcus pasteuri TaxID=45972 RepID=UPI001E320B5F|nr:hypothetical protein [Staphylococcus pasteuri]MCE3022757.1 hypothetical protein [Staphylococcus pasteuri]
MDRFKILIDRYWIYFIIGLIGGLLALFICSVLQNLLSVIDTIKILISFIALITTFGGAYLGANIAGRNASELAKKENIIREIRDTYKYTSTVLDELNRKKIIENIDSLLIRDIDRLNDIVEVNRYKIKFDETLSSYKKFLDLIQIDDILTLLSFELDNLKIHFESLSEEINECQDMLKQEIFYFVSVKKKVENFEIQGEDSAFKLKIYTDKVFAYDIDDNIYEIPKNELVKDKTNRKLEILNKKIDDVYVFWNEFSFKNKKEIRNYLVRYYKDIEEI